MNGQIDLLHLRTCKYLTGSSWLCSWLLRHRAWVCVCSAGRSGCQCQHCKDNASSLLQKSFPDFWLISQRSITCTLLFLTFEITCFTWFYSLKWCWQQQLCWTVQAGAAPELAQGRSSQAWLSGGMKCWGWDKGPSPGRWSPGLEACKGRKAGEKHGWGLQHWRDPAMTKILAERGAEKVLIPPET